MIDEDKKKAKEILKEDKDLDVTELFDDELERRKAKVLILKYLSDYTIETISDKNNLKNLVYLEIINTRLQRVLNNNQAEEKAPDAKVVRTIHENIEQISDLKEKLGITRDKQDLNSKSGYGYLQALKAKYKVWLSENQASRYMLCPHCAKQVLLKIDMNHWHAQKHPFFKDRILGNEHLIELYKQEKLTKEDLAKIFETSPDYISWLVSRWSNSSETTKDSKDSKQIEKNIKETNNAEQKK